MIQILDANRSLDRISYSFVAVACAVAAGCTGPSYPHCATDDTCRPTGEWCVDLKCAQCRTSANCPGSACATCEHGACGRVAGCCASNFDCKRGQKCADSQCIAECRADKECPVGQRCDPNGACLASALVNGGKSDGCTHDEDCSGDLRCADGLCVDVDNHCQVVPVRFDADQYVLSREIEDVLVADFKCMKQNKVRTVTVQGHDDDSSPAIGMRRASAVKTYFHTLDAKLKVKVVPSSAP